MVHDGNTMRTMTRSPMVTMKMTTMTTMTTMTNLMKTFEKVKARLGSNHSPALLTPESQDKSFHRNEVRWSPILLKI